MSSTSDCRFAASAGVGIIREVVRGVLITCSSASAGAETLGHIFSYGLQEYLRELSQLSRCPARLSHQRCVLSELVCWRDLSLWEKESFSRGQSFDRAWEKEIDGISDVISLDFSVAHGASESVLSDRQRPGDLAGRQ